VSDETSILLRVEAGVAWVTLNRPDKLNSFTQTMHEELRGVLGRIGDAGARVLVLTGAGRGFCAGQDLGQRQGTVKVDLGESLEKNYSPLVRLLRALPMPVIAAVNGVAAGAGASLALACDIVIAARSARFVLPFLHLGLVPDAGGTWSLPRHVGLPRALGMCLLGEPVPAEQAENWGLIWRCVEDESFDGVVNQTARKLARGPTLALAKTKEALYGSCHRTFEQQLGVERDFQRELGFSSDYAEGVAAFKERREPDFRGR
jgi:2-(1,2-epoxy-1,2-dihydrophenyl)acetyl-CoA isomerase